MVTLMPQYVLLIS